MLNRRTMSVAALGAMLALFAACGGETQDTSAADRDQEAASAQEEKSKASARTHDVNACDLIGEAKLSEVMGEEMQAGKGDGATSQGNVTIDQCTWLAAATKSDTVASVFFRKSTEKDAKAVFERTMKGFGDAVSVEGFRSAAYYVPSTGQLNVLVDDAWFIFTASHDGLANPREVTAEQRELATLVVRAY